MNFMLCHYFTDALKNIFFALSPEKEFYVLDTSGAKSAVLCLQFFIAIQIYKIEIMNRERKEYKKLLDYNLLTSELHQY